MYVHQYYYVKINITYLAIKNDNGTEYIQRVMVVRTGLLGKWNKTKVIPIEMSSLYLLFYEKSIKYPLS